MAGEVDIGGIVARIDGDVSGLRKALNDANGMISKASKSMSDAVNNMVKSLFSWKSVLVVTAGATGLGYFTLKCLDAADKIGKMSDVIGISTSTLQEYRYAAKLSGLSTENLDRALGVFSHNIADLKVGVGEMVTRLKDSNIELLEQLKNSNSTTEALDILFHTMGDATTQSEKMTIAYAGFSRQGIQMINMLRGGIEGLTEMREEAIKYGMVIDEDLIRKSEIANDRITRLTSSIRMKLVSSVAEAAPQIQILFEGIQKVMSHLLERMNDLSKDGSLARWAKSIASSMAESFRLIVSAIEQVVIAIDVVKIGYAALLELSLPGKIASVNKELAKTQKQLDEAWEGKWVKDAESKRKLILELENRMMALRNYEHEYTTQLKAARNMGKDSIRSLEETKAAFDGIIKEVEGIKTIIETTESASKKVSTSVEQMMDAHVKAYEKFMRKEKENISEAKKTDLMDAQVKIYYDNLKNMADEWNRISESMGSSFTDAMVDAVNGSKDAFKNFGDYIKNMFLRLWLDKAITQPIIMPVIDQTASILGFSRINAGGTAGITNSFSNFMGSTAYGSLSGASYGQIAGAGAIGYGMGGVGGGLGAAGGMYLGGPIGAIAGGAIGSAIAEYFEKESIPKIESFDLLWEVVDGKVKNVADTWRNMTKNQVVYNAAKQFVQDTTDFFTKLSTITGQAENNLNDWKFGLSGLGSDINNILTQQTAFGTMQAAFGGYGQLSEIFGSAFTDEFRSMFMDILGPSLGAYTVGSENDVFKQYMDWKFQQLISLSPEQSMSEFSSWMQSQSIFSPIGRPGISPQSIFDIFTTRNPGFDFSSPNSFAALEQFAQGATPGRSTRGEIGLLGSSAQDEWKDFFSSIEQKVNDINNLVTVGLGQAFADSLDTSEFGTFEQGLKGSIMASAQQGLIQSFSEQNLLPIIFKPFFGGNNGLAITDVLQKYSEGEIGFEETKGYLSDMFSTLDETLAGFEPVWEILNSGFKELSLALGFNTDAITNNTDAVMGPVNSLLMSLDTGPLASSQSFASLENIKNQLYAEAIANPSEFGAYSSFLTSNYLPTMQGASSDYAGLVSGIRSNITSIPWVSENMGVSSAKSIGFEVGQSLAPMLLDLKESGKITVNVVVDGQIVKSAVVDALGDREVVAVIKDM